VASVCFFVCFRDSTISGKQLSCLDETFRIDRQPLTDYAYLFWIKLKQNKESSAKRTANGMVIRL